MFSIFGTQGQLFRGALEDLRRVSRTLATQPAQAVNPLTAHMDDVDAQPFRRLLHAWPEHAEGPATAPPDRSVSSAYQKVHDSQLARQPLSTVAQVMHTPAVSVQADQSIAQAWRTLQAHGLGQAPVLDGQGRLVGLLTRAQLVRPDRLPGPDQTSLVWRTWLAQPTRAVMVSPVPAVFAGTQLRRLAQVLVDTGLPGLPVLSDADALVGFVSRTDVLRALVHDPPLDLWT